MTGWAGATGRRRGLASTPLDIAVYSPSRRCRKSSHLRGIIPFYDACAPDRDWY
ncbi:hypothetical protein KCP70_24620 [Salmonella enterica subsp. enterica]|nr:hypothetical protein KCP70_24620 [Salmonella enterica subsp. enterica]